MKTITLNLKTGCIDLNIIQRILYILANILLVFFCLIASKSITANMENNKNLTYDTISKFCEFEFRHDFSRDRFLKLSSKREDKIENLSGTIETLYIPNTYEVFAIKSYKILDVIVNKNKAIATVTYNILAKRTGWKHHDFKDGSSYGEAIFVEYIKPNYIEKINLIFDGNRWWVLDPPFPKISINKIIDFFGVKIDRLKKNHPNVVIGKALPGPQTGYNETQRNLMLLINLSKKH
jgi:hypothetical protein